jgi:hypothetical protein
MLIMRPEISTISVIIKTVLLNKHRCSDELSIHSTNIPITLVIPHNRSYATLNICVIESKYMVSSPKLLLTKINVVILIAANTIRKLHCHL